MCVCVCVVVVAGTAAARELFAAAQITFMFSCPEGHNHNADICRRAHCTVHAEPPSHPLLPLPQLASECPGGAACQSAVRDRNKDEKKYLTDAIQSSK